MTQKTNISILDNVGLRRNAMIEIGSDGSYESGIILDANAIEKMVKDLIAAVVGNAAANVDTLGELAAAIPTKVSDLNNDSGFITLSDVEAYLALQNTTEEQPSDGEPSDGEPSEEQPPL